MATLTYEPRTLAAAGSKDMRGPATAAGRKPGIFTRIFKAIEASRMQKAEIEVRRVRALMADTDPGFRDALLPFQGE
jgi:hypothetical protein